MSKKLIRLAYDQQIVDLEWRRTASSGTTGILRA
eukprot:CAMPEP_0185909842 /NCGR_PEP_ID=MMETSP0196C-20130402/15814_1 /TAXON_ID=2932 /ORGANISM="Alexandrium fundyense, Strain CCMP1719" /LENGTH=33 /DNA_ID= /DNA_START= /DNA_END= /DNA_ORIENTATION=